MAPSNDNDLNKIESTIPENASTRVTAFLAKRLQNISEKYQQLYHPLHLGALPFPNVGCIHIKLQLFWPIGYREEDF